MQYDPEQAEPGHAPANSGGERFGFKKLAAFTALWTAFYAFSDRSRESPVNTADDPEDQLTQRLRAEELDGFSIFQGPVLQEELLPHPFEQYRADQHIDDLLPSDYFPPTAAYSFNDIDAFSSPLLSLPMLPESGYQESRLFSGAGIELDYQTTSIGDDLTFLQEVVKNLETIRSRLVKEALITLDGGLRAGVAGQLQQIIDRQSSSEVHWEVFGVIDVEDERATFSTIQTTYSERLSEAIHNFAQGDNSDITTLTQALKDFQNIHGIYLQESDGPMVVASMLEMLLETYTEEGLSINAELREYIVEAFRDMITDGFTVVSPEDIPENLRHFEAIFHVHPNGSDPSPPDLSANRKDHMPDLVIAPQSDNTVKLFLVHHGRSELLFHGEL